MRVHVVLPGSMASITIQSTRFTPQPGIWVLIVVLASIAVGISEQISVKFQRVEVVDEDVLDSYP